MLSSRTVRKRRSTKPSSFSRLALPNSKKTQTGGQPVPTPESRPAVLPLKSVASKKRVDKLESKKQLTVLWRKFRWERLTDIADPGR